MAENILARMAVELSAKSTGFDKSITQSEKILASFEKSATGAANLIKGALAGISFGLIGREIIDVTSEFQKFGAVLTNTLGSTSAANIALNNIQEFAKTTPFAVDELTASFVKLANQGFAPTTDELRKLGDLASSTGKGFDQLAEAIIDAQTGEFERLKEFGIRAKKEGDNVRLTFKGVETQVKFTSQSIRDYILSLGDAEGVTGSMAAISQTLGGQISNLGDSWTQFLKVIGDGNKGALAGAVSVLNTIVQKATEWLKTTRQVQEEIQQGGQAQIVDELKDMVKVTNDLTASSEKLIARLEEEAEANSALAAPLFANYEENEKLIEQYNNKNKVIEAQIVAINDYVKAEEKNLEAQKALNAANNVSLGLIASIEAQLKEVEKQKKATFSTEEIAQFNAKIEDLKETLDVLNASRPLTKFAQELKGFVANGSNQLPEFELKLAQPDFSEVAQGQAQIQPPDMTAFQESFAEIQKQYKETGIIAYNENEQMAKGWDIQVAKQQEAAAAAVDYGTAVGDALGAAISGQMSFADAMKKLTADLLKTFLARALGGIIASAATSGGPPPVAIALAAAGVAAISAMFAKIGGPSKSVGGSLSKSSSTQSVQRLDQQFGAQQIVLAGEFKLRGKDLALAIDKERTTQQRTG